jgi:predicted ArsR family transcriptional regulator
MTISQINKRESPLWHIVEHLQRNGSATIRELEDLLGVTTTAVRQHLTTCRGKDI